MSEQLTVSGGGSIAVATEDLLVLAALLRTAAADVESAEAASQRALLAALALTGSAAGELSAALGHVGGDLQEIRLLSAGLWHGLEAAATGYGTVDLLARRAADAAVGTLAWAGGRLFPLLALISPVPRLTAAAWALTTLAPELTTGVVGGVRNWLLANPWLTSNQLLVELVRLAGTSLDDALRGLVGLPLTIPGSPAGAGSEALVGQEEGALLLLAGLGVAGVAGGGKVETRRTLREPVLPPRSVAELADRVPSPHAGEAQVRIDRFADASGRLRYVVYLGGTVSAIGGAGGETFDMPSNVAAVAGAPSAAYLATLAAMEAAGIDKTDPVLLVGYSQGGLVAARIAESGDYSVKGMVTLGAPTAGVESLADVPVLALEHSEDIVPAIAGTAAALSSRLVVRRSLYEGKTVPLGVQLPAHQLAPYRQTAALVDGSAAPSLVAARSRIDDFFLGTATGESTRWRSERASGQASDPSARAAGR